MTPFNSSAFEPLNPPPDPAAEIARLRRKATIWTWVAVAGVILTAWSWLGRPSRRTPESTASTPSIPSTPVGRPAYIKAVTATPEGFGFIFSFILAAPDGSPVRCPGKVLLRLFDEYYGYRGASQELLLRKAYPVTLSDFAPTVSGCMGCFLPRVDLSNVSIHQNTTGAYYWIVFITPDGDTLPTRARTPWPL